MRSYPVSNRVNRPENDHAECAREVQEDTSGKEKLSYWTIAALSGKSCDSSQIKSFAVASGWSRIVKWRKWASTTSASSTVRSNHNSINRLLLTDVKHLRNAEAFPGSVAGENQVVCQLGRRAVCEIHHGSHAEKHSSPDDPEQMALPRVPLRSHPEGSCARVITRTGIASGILLGICALRQSAEPPDGDRITASESAYQNSCFPSPPLPFVQRHLTLAPTRRREPNRFTLPEMHNFQCRTVLLCRS